MLEIPESCVISGQIDKALKGRTITGAVANQSPHGFAWYHGSPDDYPALLTGRTITGARPIAGLITVQTDGAKMLFNDGVNLRLLAHGKKRPAKHQLLLEMDDGAALVGSVQMYGGLIAYPDSYVDDNPYHVGAEQKPSPLTGAFDEAYFDNLFAQAKRSLSVKAFLATEQRIPGLGNGVLQDILFLTGLHPARPISTLDDSLARALYRNVKDVLRRMTDEGGRNTEKDLYGNPGGYRTLLSRLTLPFPCPQCGGPIERKAYLGGNVYFCAKCQPLVKG